MNLFKHILCIFILGLSLQHKAQSAIGFELNVNKDYSKISDPGNQFEPGQGLNVSAGFSYKYIFNNDVFMYTGVSLKLYNNYLKLKSFQMSTTSSDNVAIHVPLGFGYRFALVKEKIYFSPVVGSAVNYLLFETGGSSMGKAATRSDSIVYSTNTIYPKRFFPTVSLGFLLEFYFGPQVSLAFTMQMNKGFNTMSSQEITYRHNTDPITIATQSSEGSYLTGLGIKVYYHFNSKQE